MPEDESKLDDILAQMSRQSDSGFALLFAARVDTELQKLLLTAMRPLSNNIAERIFENMGPLYELAPKADMAYAFNLFDQDTLSDLRVIFRVRNKSAHSDELLHFESKTIGTICQAFSEWKPGSVNMLLYQKAALDSIAKFDAKCESLIFEQGKPIDS